MRFVKHFTFGSNRPSTKSRKGLKYRETTFVWEIIGDFNQMRRILNFFVSDKPNLSSSIEVKIGVAVAHPDDKFSKKTGTEIAVKNMKFVDFDLCSAKIIQRERGRVVNLILNKNLQISKNRKIKTTLSVCYFLDIGKVRSEVIVEDI